VPTNEELILHVIKLRNTLRRVIMADNLDAAQTTAVEGLKSSDARMDANMKVAGTGRAA
jgi:hypothetical protein